MVKDLPWGWRKVEVTEPISSEAQSGEPVFKSGTGFENLASDRYPTFRGLLSNAHMQDYWYDYEADNAATVAEQFNQDEWQRLEDDIPDLSVDEQTGCAYILSSFHTVRSARILIGLCVDSDSWLSLTALGSMCSILDIIEISQEQLAIIRKAMAARNPSNKISAGTLRELDVVLARSEARIAAMKSHNS